MSPGEFPLLADENIHPEVVRSLRALGKDVRTVLEEGLQGCDDEVVLQRAQDQGRVVVTHDADFGRLVTQASAKCTGIIYLRPGHISPIFVVEMLRALESLPLVVSPPFILVAERKGETIRVRLRSQVETPPHR